MTCLADPSANIIFGVVVDDRYDGEIHVTIIATGFSQSFQETLLGDPKATKVGDRSAAVGPENRGMPLVLKPLTPPSIASRSSTRKLFF